VFYILLERMRGMSGKLLVSPPSEAEAWTKDAMMKHPLPVGLTELIVKGVWPSMNGPSMTAQQLSPIVPADRVRQFAAQESLICLQPPPFRTLAVEMAAWKTDEFWKQFGALDQIDPEHALIIGDFGLGSEAPVILDFARNPSNPPVLWLRWGPNRQTEWVQGAKDFSEFAEMLGLTQS
jgi:hypothetical protein